MPPTIAKTNLNSLRYKRTKHEMQTSDVWKLTISMLTHELTSNLNH